MGFYNNLTKHLSNELANRNASKNEHQEFQIEFRTVSFRYAKDDSFSIADVNLSIAEFESIAIVGKSGSGKSTLMEMLIGNLDPKIGSLFIGGMPPNHFILANPGSIGLVPQEIPIFNKSVAENIALGIPLESIDLHLIEDLIRRVGLTPLIKSFPDGVFTKIGDSGLGLSGGQRQRIGIARSLYYTPRILIFDEATSSLDAESEKMISNLIIDKDLNCTKIVIAHRLSSIKNFQRIVYLDSGRIVDVGTFEYLRGKIAEFDSQARLLGL